MLRFIQQVPNNVYYALFEEKGELFYNLVDGKEITFKGYEDCDFFFYKHNSIWKIAEGFTGQTISEDKSFAEAKKEATSILIDNREGFTKMIVDTINEQETSPRFFRINNPHKNNVAS